MQKENDLLENELLIDNLGKTHLKETAMWAKLLGVTGIILSILIAAAAIFAGAFFNKLTAGLPGRGDTPNYMMASGMIMVVYLIVAAVVFFMALFIYRFAIKMKVALNSNDQESLNLSFLNLKIYYRFAGIITIIYFIIVFFALIGGVFALMMTRQFN